MLSSTPALPTSEKNLTLTFSGGCNITNTGGEAGRIFLNGEWQPLYVKSAGSSVVIATDDGEGVEITIARGSGSASATSGSLSAPMLNDGSQIEAIELDHAEW